MPKIYHVVMGKSRGIVLIFTKKVTNDHALWLEDTGAVPAVPLSYQGAA